MLMQCFQQPQKDISALLQQQQPNTNLNTTSTSPQSISDHSLGARPKPTDHYNNAKYEDIAFRPIKPPYDGSTDHLVSFLNCLDIRRQDETWSSVTYIQHDGKSHDLIRDFATIPSEVMTTLAKTRWTSPTLDINKYTFGHPTYNSRCLAKLLLCSVTDDFSTLIISRIDQTLRNDGPLLLWTICQNIYRNNIAFVESIKAKIRSASMSHFGDDAQKYLSFCRDNLRLITTSDANAQSHNDLITYNFTTLSTSSIVPFKEEIQKWHVAFLEAKDKDLTPANLVKRADDKIQVLQHAGLWKEVEPPAVMALKLELEQQKQGQQQLVQQIVAHLSNFTNQNTRKPGGPSGYQHPTWMTTPPHSITEISKVVNGKTYVWCTRCRQGKGLWVCTHSTETHQDGYRRERTTSNEHQQHSLSQNMHQQHKPQPSYPYPPQYPTPPQPRAQLSLNDYIDNCFNESSAGIFDEDYNANQPEPPGTNDDNPLHEDL
jgi:hypothetical protein